jgi:excinuclease ABC subunit A
MRLSVLAPLVRDRKGEYRKELQDLRKAGFARVRVDGELRDLGEDIVLKKTFKHTIEVVVDRLVVKAGIEKRLADSLDTALKWANDLVAIESQATATAPLEQHLFSQRLAWPYCVVSYPELAPRMFSFNSPHGACPTCSGLGVERVFDPERIVADESKPLDKGCDRRAARVDARGVCRHFGVKPDTPWQKVSAEVRRIFPGGRRGHGDRVPVRQGRKVKRRFEGVLAVLQRRYRETESNLRREELEAYQSERPCVTCGERASAARLSSSSSGPLDQRSPRCRSRRRLASSRSSAREDQAEIARLVLREIRERLGFLLDVGLHLSHARAGRGDAVGGGASESAWHRSGPRSSGVLYILDEPSIGLHQRDNERHARGLSNAFATSATRSSSSSTTATPCGRRTTSSTWGPERVASAGGSSRRGLPRRWSGPPHP